MLTKNAIGNLINKYKAVLKKCHLLNTFGSLAVVGMLTAGVLGGHMAGPAYGVTLPPTLGGNSAFTVTQPLSAAADPNDYYTTFVVKEADDQGNITEKTYGIKFKGSGASGSLGETNSIVELVKDYIANKIVKSQGAGLVYTVSQSGNDIKISFDSHGSSNNVTFTVDPDTGAVTFSKDWSGSPNKKAYEGEQGSPNLNENFIGNESTTSGGAISNTYNDYYGEIFDSSVGDITGDFIANSTTQHGGAISNIGYDSGQYSDIGNITGDFIGNKASGGSGGAIYNNYYADIKDITGDFIGNSASEHGGAIYSYYYSGIKDITGDFIGNSATKYGGAIYNEKYVSIVDINGDFINNSAGSRGGAIYNNYEGTISNVIGDFIGNSSGSNGGAIYNGISAQIAINNSNVFQGDFINNSANKHGGAIYNSIYARIGNITGDFIQNTAKTGSGGAIYNYYYSSISNITGDFIDNSAAKGGGAIFNKSNASMFSYISSIGNIEGDFIGNSTTDEGGGAIYNHTTAKIGNITGNFIQNNANDSNGGAIFNEGQDDIYFSVIGNITGNFIDNFAGAGHGGAIYNKQYATIGNITGNFINNNANYSGGAIFNAYSSKIVDIIGDFINNDAKKFGGAIYNFSSAALGNITGNFSDNSASQSGGAIYNSSASIGNITGNFINNITTQHGGAIFNSNVASIKTIKGNFSGNQSLGGSGGAIYNFYAGSIDGIQGDFINNSATVNGGAIFSDSSLSIGTIDKDVLISGNIAGKDTAAERYNAIYMSGNSINLTFDVSKHNITLNDTVEFSSDDGTGININGGNTFNLNNEFTNVASVNLNTSTLNFGSFTHADSSITSGSIGDAALNVSGESTLSSTIDLELDASIDIKDAAVLNVTAGNLTFKNATAAFVSSGTLNIIGAGLTLASAVNSWGTVDLHSGSLTLAGTGTNTLSSSALNIFGGTLSIGGTGIWKLNNDLNTTEGTLKINSGARLDISYNTLTSNLADFGKVNLNGYDASFVENSDMAGILTGTDTSDLELKTGLTDITLLDNYHELITQIATALNGFTGNITIEGYGQYMSLSNIPVGGLTMPDLVIAAGDYSLANISTFAGIEQNRDGTSASTISNGGLVLTGIGGVDFSKGDITVTHGTISLGRFRQDDIGGKIQGDLILDELGDDTKNAHGESNAQTVTVTGTTKILNGASFTINSGSTFTSQGGIVVDNDSALSTFANLNLSSFTLKNEGRIGMTGNTVTVDSLNLGGTVSIAGTGTLSASTISNTTAVKIYDYSGPTGGKLTLASNGTWNAGANVKLDEGTLTLASGSTMNMASHTLSTSAANNTLNMTGATLTLNIGNLGSVDFTTDPNNVFTKNNTIAGTVTSDASSILNINGLSGTTLNEFEYLDLEKETKEEAFSSAFLGTVNFSGITVNAVSLSGVTKTWETPAASLMAGELKYVGDTTISHITENTYTGYATTDSTISGAGVNLTLTGQGAGGPLSTGNVTVNNGASLTLGVANSPDGVLAFAGGINVSGTNSKVTIQDITVRLSAADPADNKVSLATGASLEVNDALIVNNISFDNTSMVNIGTEVGASENSTLTIIGDYSIASDKLSATTAAGKMAIGSNGVLDVDGDLEVTGGGDISIANGGKITAYAYTFTNNTLSSGELSLSVGNASSLTGGLTINNAESKLTIHNGHATDAVSLGKLTVSDGTLNIRNGKVKTTDTIEFAANGVLVVSADATLDISSQSLTANVKDFGKVTLDANGYKFLSLNETTANVKTNLTGDDQTTLVLNTGIDPADIILLDNYNELLAGLKDSIFGTGYAGTLTIDGYGQFQSLSTINVATDDPTEVVAAGNYSHNVESTFAGIVADRSGNAASSITGGGTLNLSGDGGKALSTGNITVTRGALWLGYDGNKTQGGTVEGDITVNSSLSSVSSLGTDVTVNGDVNITNGGRFTVESTSTFTATNGVIVDGSASLFEANTDVSLASLTIRNGGNLETVDGKTVTVGSLTLNNVAKLNSTNTTLKATNIINTTAVAIEGGGNLELTGTWNAGANVELNDGKFTLASGAGLNMGSHTLSTSAANNTLNMAGATLTLNIGNLGSVDFTTDPNNVFTKNNTIAGTVTSDASSILNINGLSGTTLNEFEYLDLEKETKEEAFSSAFLGTVNFSGITVNAVSLSGVTKTWETPAASLMAGELKYVGDTTISHITENTYTGYATTDSTISGAGVNLVLTGQGVTNTGSGYVLSEGDISVSNGASLTLNLENSNTHLINGAISLTDADLMLTKGDVEVVSFNMNDKSQFKISEGSLFSIENDYTADVAKFSSSAQEDKIFIENGSLFASKNTLTLNGGGELNLANKATLGGKNITLGSATILTSGDIELRGGSLSGALTVNGTDAQLVTLNDTSISSKLTIQEGTLAIRDGTLTAGAEIYIGTKGTIKTFNSGTLSLLDQRLTANTKDFATINLDDQGYNFVSLDNTNQSVHSLFVGNNGTNIVLNANTNSADLILLDNYDDLIAAFKKDLFGDNYQGVLKINGYAQYQTLSSINAYTNEPSAVVAAGDYTYSNTSTFAGIVADRQGNADSTISGGGELILTGNNNTALSAGNITVTDGTLGLGIASNPTDGGTVKGNLIVNHISGTKARVYSLGTLVVIEGKAEIKNGGMLEVQNGTLTVNEGINIDAASQFKVLQNTNVNTTSLVLADSDGLYIEPNAILAVSSNVDLVGGAMNFGERGTLEAAGFTNNTSALTLTNGTLKTTAGMTTNQDLTLGTEGVFELAGGEANFSKIVFTATNADSLKTATGTTLTANIGTIGVNADATTTAAPAATVQQGNASTNVQGKVVIAGLNSQTLDVAAAGRLSTAAKASYGDNVNVIFNGITFDSGITLTTIGDEGLVGFGESLVDVGSGLGAGETAIVGGLKGSGSATNAGDLTLTGSASSEVEIINTGKLTSNGGSIEKVTNNGGAVEIKGNTEVEEFTQDGGGTTKVEKTLIVENLTLNSGTMDVGSSTAKADVIAQNVVGGGNMIFHDPAWVDGVGISGASTGVYKSFASGNVDAKLVAGQNSFVVLGDVSTAWAKASFANSGLTWGETATTAALFINSPQTLAANGAVQVDGSLQAAPGPPANNSATFADKSLLTVNASNLGGAAALTANGGAGGTLNVTAGANLIISGGTGGQTVTVVSGFNGATAVAANAWGVGEVYDTTTASYVTLKTDSRAVGIDNTTTTFLGGGAFVVGLKSLQVTLPMVGGSVNDFLTEAGNAGLTGARDELIGYILDPNTPASEAAALAQGTPQAASVTAVAASGLDVGLAASSAVVARNSATGMNASAQTISAVNLDDGQASLDSGLNAGDPQSGMKNGVGLWIMPLYEWSTVSGMKSDGFTSDYKTGLGGMAVGADYTFNNKYRLGLAFNVGAGHTQSSGDFFDGTNSFDFWGLSLYAGYRHENLSLSADIGYSGISNQVNQDTMTTLGASRVSADISSQVWTFGLNAEYVFKTEFMDIVPHAGVRLMSVTTNAHDLESSGQTMYEVESTTQNVWYFPVGVTLSKDIATESGWTFTPKVDLGFIAAAGDLNATTKASMPSVNTPMEIEMKNVDGFAFNGGLGIDLANADNGISLGLNYNLQASEHETGHMIFATFRYEF